MSCIQEIPCNITPTSVLTYLGAAQFGLEDTPDPSACYLCLSQKQYSRTVPCLSHWPDGDVYGVPQPGWKGHGTSIWIMNHGPVPEDVEAALASAREWFQGVRGGEPRGHYKLQLYGGHWGLERFEAAKTIPFPLSNGIAWKANDAVMWFFDPERMLEDPIPYRRDISDEETRRRIEGYQYFIDRETQRALNQKTYRELPPLRELPYEQQRRLVQWFDRLWNDFLDFHPDWRWTPALGFWRAAETIYPLTEEAHG